MSAPPLRVLHVVSHFPPDRVGGVGEVAAHIHRGLLERGHDSHVLTTGTSSDDPRVRRIDTGPGHRYTLASVRHRRWAATFDIVHAHHGEALPLLAALRGSATRTLMTLHVDNRLIARANRPIDGAGASATALGHVFTPTAIRDAAKVVLDRAACRVVDGCSFISTAGADEVLGSGHGTTVIHNGVPVPVPWPSDERRDPMELLYVGTAGARKRTALLPALLATVRASAPTATLRIVGFDPADQPDLAAGFAAAGVAEAVRFEGAVRSDQLGRWYRRAGVLVIPSAYEGLPMVALEALSHGLPVIATDVGGVREAIDDGVHGLLVPADDVAALASACIDLLGDQVRATAMGAAGRGRVAAEFGIERQVADYVSLYRALVER